MDPTIDLTVDPTPDPTADALTVTVSDAAKLLGLSSEAVRMRVKRGTLASTRIAGSVYVVLDRPNPEPHRPNGGPNGSVGGPNGRTNGHPDVGNPGADALLVAKDEALEDLRDRVAQLSRIVETRDEEIRRRDHIIMSLTSRIPELEAPSEAPQVPQETTHRPHDDGDSRSWWRRVFGG